MITRSQLDGLAEAELVEFTETALRRLHERYTDEPTLLTRFGEAGADDVRLAIENALDGFDRFTDHYTETVEGTAPSVHILMFGRIVDTEGPS